MLFKMVFKNHRPESSVTVASLCQIRAETTITGFTPLTARSLVGVVKKNLITKNLLSYWHTVNHGFEVIYRFT